MIRRIYHRYYVARSTTSCTMPGRVSLIHHDTRGRVSLMQHDTGGCTSFTQDTRGRTQRRCSYNKIPGITASLYKTIPEIVRCSYNAMPSTTAYNKIPGTPIAYSTLRRSYNKIPEVLPGSNNVIAEVMRRSCNKMS